jgi:hypothetical protein
MEYRYGDDSIETNASFETSLDEARFRLNHLGYSAHETRDKFDAAASHWSRTGNLRLTFAKFHAALTSIDFASLTSADMKPFI